MLFVVCVIFDWEVEVVCILFSIGGMDVEEVVGCWCNGEWVDFDLFSLVKFNLMIV